MTHAMGPRVAVAIGVWSLFALATGCATSSTPTATSSAKDAGTQPAAVDAGNADASPAKDAGGSGFTPGLQYNGSIGFERAQ